MNQQGFIIAIEGIDGVGKSTQIKNLEAYLKNQGIEVVTFREPGGTEIGENIRSILKNTDFSNMAQLTELFLFLAARAQLVEEKMKPLLQRNVCILCDRFIHSTYAYQGYGREAFIEMETLETLMQLVLNGLGERRQVPDLVIQLDMDPQQAQERFELRNLKEEQSQVSAERIEQEGLAFMERVCSGYRELQKKNSAFYYSVDASLKETEVFEKIKDVLEKYQAFQCFKKSITA